MKHAQMLAIQMTCLAQTMRSTAGEYFKEAGWNVEQTQASNDQGVDLIARIEDLKVCVQCKRYSNPVGNKAVQEVVLAKPFIAAPMLLLYRILDSQRRQRTLLNLQM